MIKKVLFLIVSIQSICYSQNSKGIELLRSNFVKVKFHFDSNNIDSVNHFIGQIIEIDRLYPISFSIKDEIDDRDSIFKESIKILDTILSNKNLYVSLFNRATLLSKTGQFTLAIEDYQQTILIDSTPFAVYFNLGKLYERKEEYLKAYLSYDKAIDRNSNKSTVYLNRGYALLKLNSYELAIKDFETALNKSPNRKEKSYILNNLGYANLCIGKTKTALDQILNSIATYDKNSYAYKNLGLVYIELNKTKEACVSFKEALDLGYTKEYGNEINELIDKHCYDKK